MKHQRPFRMGSLHLCFSIFVLSDRDTEHRNTQYDYIITFLAYGKCFDIKENKKKQ